MSGLRTYFKGLKQNLTQDAKIYEDNPQISVKENGVDVARLSLSWNEWDALKTKTESLRDIPEPPPPPPPASVGPTPPSLSNPTTIVAKTGQTFNLDPTKDYIITQSGPIAGGARFNGGRNIIWRGMRVHIPVVPNSAGAAFHTARNAPHFEGFKGHLFIEDFRITGDVGEGIIGNGDFKVTIYNGRTELVTRAYTRMVNGVAVGRAPTWGTSYTTRGTPTYDGLTSYVTGIYWDQHNDCFQSWSMPQEIHIEKVTGVTPCQFMYLEPDTGNRKLTLKDINVRQYVAPWDGSKISDHYFWAQGWEVTVDNVWSDNGKTNFGVPNVQNGIPPSGDFVP
jgi:hypothetical protein